MEKQFSVSDVVWARARKPKIDIFWPAQVVETEKDTGRSNKKVIASVKFLGEDTYGDIKYSKDIMDWDCQEQHDLIHSGRVSIKEPRKKICFNKGVAEARKLFGYSAENKRKIKMRDGKSKTPANESPTSNKGNKSSDIKFVDESTTVPMVTEQICKTKADESGRIEEKNEDKDTSVKIKNKAGARKRVNSNKSKEVNTRNGEPIVKRSKGVFICEDVRRCPRKCSVKVSTIKKEEENRKSATLSKRKETSTQFVGNAHDDEKRNEMNVKNSPALNRKRKREDTIQNGVNPAELESKDNKLNASKSPVKLSKKRGNNNQKQKMTENNQLQKNIVNKRPLPNNGRHDNPSQMEKEKSVASNRKEKSEEWESDSCSDEELMEAALSPSKNFKFELNDVVWAKLYRDPFWPAQVKRINLNKKAKKIYVQFLGYDNKSCFSCKRLVPFACESEKREEFVKEAMNKYPQKFEEARVMAEDMVRRKALGIKDQKEEEEEEEKDDGHELVDTANVKEETNEGKEGTSSVTEDKPKKETNVRRLSRSVKRPSKYKDILTYIREAKPFLKEIFEEKKACVRHQIFKKGSAKEKNSLKRRSGFGPVTDSDLENDIMELLQEHYRELVGTEDFSEITYISDVWLPEAIIYALQKIEKVDRRTAESLFQQGSSPGAQSRRFTQRLKAKTLTQEEKEESLQRANKSFRSSFDI